MKILPVIISFILCAAPTYAEIVFQGYMITKGKPLFVLSVDKEKTSGWLAIGQNFAGVSILAFDTKSELLTVEKDGTRQVLRVVDGKVQTASEVTSPSGTKPIVISIGDSERISVGDDAAMVDALKAKLALVAATEPQPTITIIPPNDTKFDRLTTILDLIRAAGVKRFDIRTETSRTN